MDLVRALRDHLAGRVSDALDDREAASHDESGGPAVIPEVVVVPDGLDDVVETIRIARRLRVPVTARGGGSGKAGGCVPVEGGIVLDTRQLRARLDVDPKSDIVVASAGHTTAEVAACAKSAARVYGPDPGAMDWCTIAGNVATNAGGPRAFKYGSTRASLLGLQAVTGQAELMRFGGGTLKRSVGFDLATLFAGSEGTLGIITEVTLRVVAAAEERATVLVELRDVDAAVHLVDMLLTMRVGLSAVELLDATALQALRRREPQFFAGQAALLLEVESDGAIDAALDRLQKTADAAHALECRIGRNAGDGERLWQLRGIASEEIRKLAKHKLSEDVCVPRGRLSELTRGVAAIAERHQLLHAAYGHAGDGNLHVNFLWNDETERAAVDHALGETFRLATSLGGVLSGEHGIGRLKQPYLRLACPREELLLRRALKQQFDPLGIMNPGVGPYQH